MKNLAGNEECDKHVRHELERCRIPIVEITRAKSEVPYSLVGQLGNYRFTRAWYYWVVSGFVPLEVARRLHADPVGRTDVRVDGHCGCPAPEPPWARYFDMDGREVLTMADHEEMVSLSAKSPVMRKTFEQSAHRYRYAPEPSRVAELYVTTYHVDSELGLYLLAEALRGISRPLPRRMD